MKRIIVPACLLALAATAAAQQPPRIYQSVTVSADRIAFVYGDQIWEVPRAGGTAKRISSAADAHSFALYSPDGSQLAYVRANAVWVMPAGGGEARRLTWYPRLPFVRAWTPDGKHILFSSARDGDGNQRGVLVPAAGGPESMLALNPVRFASCSPDGKHIALIGHSMFLGGVDRRYARGGANDPIMLIDPATGRGPAIPNGSANAIFPMWIGDKVYFATDSLGSFNLAVYDTASKRVRLLTQWKSFGITAASAGGGAIAFVRDGRIHLFDVATGKLATPAIDIPADTTELTPRNAPAARFTQFVNAGPRGESAALEVRGDVVILDARTGEARNLTQTPGVAERQPTISPDGRQVAYYSDASGEYALHVRAIDGSGEARVIQLGSKPTYFRGISWSPDNRRIAFSDQRLVLWLADVSAGRAVPVDSSRWIAQDLWQTSWSPDGRLLAYAKADPKGIRAVWLRDVESNNAWRVSSGGSDDVWPIIDPSGRWLYFASSTNSGNAPARAVWSLLSDFFAQPLVSYRLMVATLRAGDVLPVLPFGGPNPQGKEPAKGALDPAGAASRVAPLAVSQRTVEQLWMTPKGSIIMQAAVWPATPAVDNPGSEVVLIDPVSAQQSALARSVRSAEVSSDGTTVRVRRGNDYTMYVVGGDSVKIDLSKVTVPVQPRAEWAQIYHEAFRMMRDYFYDPNHHGVDVPALERHYAAYLPHLTRRTDLNDLLTYAFGEISISHLGVGGGEVPNVQPPNDRVGVLGADYRIENGRYRFARLMRNGPYQLLSTLTRAPLDQPGVDVKEGEYLLAVDSVNVTADRPVDFFFVGKAGRPTTVRVGPSADGSGARNVVVVPTIGENALRRANWAEANRREVEQRSGGRLAYVYIDSWSPSGLSELNRVLNGSNAQGLIIDERWNGGGITADQAIDALSRVPWYRYQYRYGDGFTVPQHYMEGPKVLLIHEGNFSAAETFALMFKERRVGTIVGRRTGGGGIGGALFYQTLVDGGRVTIPNRASYNSRLGRWDIENHGVEPDVDVEITQGDAVAGRDPQLDMAISVAMKALATWKPTVMKKPEMARHPAREP